MSVAGRLVFDVSYTRTQAGNVGITRTVRRLLQALQALQPAAADCIPAGFHSRGFRHASPPVDQGLKPVNQRAPSRLYRWLTGGWVRRFAESCIPLTLLRAAWSGASSWTFDALSAKDAPIAFAPGDWLVLADESWNYDAWEGVRLARAAGARAVLVLYDLIPLRQPQYCARLFTLAFDKWLREMTACCDLVLCISHATELDYLAYCCEQGLTPPQTSHFRLGCDVPTAGRTEVRPPVRRMFGEAGPCFAAIGTIEPRKNYQVLLEVFERLWARNVDARLLIAGRPHPACHRLLSRMQQHTQQGRLLLTVQDATDSEINFIYANVRALLFPSLAEGFGLPLVEARTLGCAVIASDLPVLREFADGGVDFFAPNSADELEMRILAHLQSGRASAPPMKPFTWEDSGNAVLAAVAQADAIIGEACRQQSRGAARAGSAVAASAGRTNMGEGRS